MTSFKPEVTIEKNGKWCGNALRFATREEAEAQVRDLSYRWMGMEDWRVVESDDPVNSAYVNGRLVEVTPAIAIEIPVKG